MPHLEEVPSLNSACKRPSFAGGEGVLPCIHGTGRTQEKSHVMATFAPPTPRRRLPAPRYSQALAHRSLSKALAQQAWSAVYAVECALPAWSQRERRNAK